MTPRPAWLTPSETPASGMFDAIYLALEASCEPVIGPATIRLLVLPLHDDDGAVAGGLWGYTQFKWLVIEMLVVPVSLRGRGIGSALMAAAEAEARARGCLGVQVDTFSFQATGFYEKLGFTVYGILDDFPPGHHRVYFQKPFQQGA